MKTNKQWKRVPFDIELAKKIQAGEIEGRIVTKDGTLVKLKVNPKYDERLITISRIDDYLEVNYNNAKRLSWLNYQNLLIELPEETPKLDDITTREGFHNAFSKREFKSFDKVLVRDIPGQWSAAYYSHYDKEEDKYSCGGVLFDECIPYKGNEHLLGTTDKPKED